jgi:O-antigen ligase
MPCLKKITEYLFYLFIFLVPWQTKLILRPAPTNFTEISLYATQFLLLVILLLFFIHRLGDKKSEINIPLAWYLLIGWELFIFISIWIAPDSVLAAYHYLSFVIGLAVFFLLYIGTGAGSYEDNFFAKGKIIFSFLAGVFIQAILGIAQFLEQSSFACKYLGLAAHDPSVLGTSVVEVASGRWLRAYGGLDHPNILGGVLAVALLLAAYLLAKKKILHKKREVAESILLFIFYFICLFALFFTFSRAAWLSLAVGLIILLIYFIRRKDKWVTGRFVALLFFSAVLLAIVFFPYQELVVARMSDSQPLEQKSITERETYVGQALNIIASRPLLGVGLGNYTTVLAQRSGAKDLKVSAVWSYQPVHDVFLLIWAESGIFALLFFLGFLFHWLFSLPFGLLFLFLVLGLI